MKQNILRKNAENSTNNLRISPVIDFELYEKPNNNPLKSARVIDNN